MLKLRGPYPGPSEANGEASSGLSWALSAVRHTGGWCLGAQSFMTFLLT